MLIIGVVFVSLFHILVKENNGYSPLATPQVEANGSVNTSDCSNSTHSSTTPPHPPSPPTHFRMTATDWLKNTQVNKGVGMLIWRLSSVTEVLKSYKKVNNCFILRNNRMAEWDTEGCFGNFVEHRPHLITSYSYILSSPYYHHSLKRQVVEFLKGMPSLSFYSSIISYLLLLCSSILSW